MEDTSSKLFITVTPKIEMNPTAAEIDSGMSRSQRAMMTARAATYDNA